MVILTWLGMSAWLFPAEDALAADAAGAHGRLNYPVEAGRQISLIIIGFQLFWEIPMSCTKELHRPLALQHHVAVVISAFLSLKPYVQYYVPYFGAAIELPVILLVIVNTFRSSM